MGVAISALPVHERPRERLLKCGVEALNERELLALVLRSGRRGESSLDLAAGLLSGFGGISGLMGARPEELAAHPGVGPAKAAALVAALRLGRLDHRMTDQPRLRTPADIADAAREMLEGQRRERLVVLVCDSANRLRQTVVVSEGAVDQSIVPVREILNAVLRHDGRAFAIAHNHPSGDLEPSNADMRTTAELSIAARTVGLRFLDHVIVAGGYWSRVPATRTRQTPD